MARKKKKTNTSGSSASRQTRSGTRPSKSGGSGAKPEEKKAATPATDEAEEEAAEETAAAASKPAAEKPAPKPAEKKEAAKPEPEPEPEPEEPEAEEEDEPEVAEDDAADEEEDFADDDDASDDAADEAEDEEDDAEEDEDDEPAADDDEEEADDSDDEEEEEQPARPTPKRRIVARKPPVTTRSSAESKKTAASDKPAASKKSDEPDAAPSSGRALPARARLSRPQRSAAAGGTGGGGGTDRRARAARTAASSPRIVIEDPSANDGEVRRLSDILQMRVLGSGAPGLAVMSNFMRKLSALITAGIPLVRSMKLLAERTAHVELRKATAAVARDVESGTSLSEAMQAHPHVFDRITVSVVQVGEVGGILEDSLRRLSDILDRKSRVRKQVIAAATYPLALSVMAIATVVIIMMTVVPVFEETYQQNETPLKWPTQLVIDISDHFQALWWFDLIVLVGAFFLFRFYTRESPIGRRRWESLRLNMPIIGPIIRLLNSARFCRTLGGLLSAGIPLWESLGVAAETSESAIVTDTVDRVRDAVENGQKLEPNLRDSTCFTPEMLDIVGIGEESGMLEQMMLSMADSYEDEVTSRLVALIELLKPMLLFIVGGCIILILVAVYLPYFDMIKLIGQEN